jgi:hypothetical protein
VAPDFPDAVGWAVYERATEQLALDALAASQRGPKVAEYPIERSLVAAVAQRVGHGRLARDYVNRSKDLADLVRAIGAAALDEVTSDVEPRSRAPSCVR